MSVAAVNPARSRDFSNLDPPIAAASRRIASPNVAGTPRKDDAQRRLHQTRAVHRVLGAGRRVTCLG
jgi:hypothetical protein